LNEAVGYGINVTAFWYVFHLFKRVLAVGCVYETSVFADIYIHTHTHTRILHVGFLNFKREGGNENLIYYWGVTSTFGGMKISKLEEIHPKLFVLVFHSFFLSHFYCAEWFV
jgi:hypothetical protein